MVLSEAKELFRQLLKQAFPEYMVVYSNQPRTPKPTIPLVLLTTGSINRPQFPNDIIDDGVPVSHYLTRLPIIVDLFTNGSAVLDNTGSAVAYEDSSSEEVLKMNDFLNSWACVNWCDAHNVSILIESDVQNLSAVLTDSNYAYRSRQEVLFYFTQDTAQTIGDQHFGSFSKANIEGSY